MSRFTRTALAVASVVSAAALLAGCAAGTSSDSAPAGEPTDGGTLTYLEPQTWTTLYPPSSGFYPNSGVINNITDRLLYQDPVTLELQPWIATALPEVNADATEYTFTLRDGVTYSDGTPLDAENVVKNFDLYGKGDATRKPAESINNYDHGEVIDDHTVKFVFSAPAPGFAQATSTYTTGLLANATLDLGLDKFGPGNADQIIASGPFVISKEDLGKQLSLTARDDYDWAPPSFSHQGRAYLDGIDYIVAAEDSVRVGTVTSGQADLARAIAAPDEAQFSGNGLSLVAAATNGVNNAFNLRFQEPALSDIRVRQAFIAGVDRETILKTLFSENYPLATGVLAKTAAGYTDTSSYYVYDPAKATSLLDAAGWVPGADGIREKDGVRLTLTFTEALPQPRSKEVVTLVQEQLKKIGIEVKLYPGDQVAQDTAEKDGKLIQVFHTMVGRADYDVIKSQYSAQNRNALLNGVLAADGSITSLGDPTLEDLLRKVASEPTSEGRAAASAAAQQRMAEQAYLLPLFEEPQVFGLNAAVQGFSTDAVGRPAFYNTWLNR